MHSGPAHAWMHWLALLERLHSVRKVHRWHPAAAFALGVWYGLHRRFSPSVT